MKLLSCLLLTSIAVAQSQKSHSISNTVMLRPGSGYLGVAFVDRADGHGVEIKFVEIDSPAARAGLKPDDVVVEFNGQRVESTPQFTKLVSEFPAGRKVRLGILRGGASLMLTATLEPRIAMHELPEPPNAPNPPTVILPDLPRMNMLWRNGVLGIETEELSPQLAEYFGVTQGLLVRMVNRDSSAGRAGLKAGDVIVKAAGKQVTATRDMSTLLQNRKAVTLGVVRNHKDLSLEVLLN